MFNWQIVMVINQVIKRIYWVSSVCPALFGPLYLDSATGENYKSIYDLIFIGVTQN